MIGELRQLIKTTLFPLGLYSPEAEELLCATCANESHLGQYRRQTNGPALGIFQMEPATHDDIWQNYLKYHADLGAKISNLVASGTPFIPHAEALVTNDEYAIAMARVQYLRAKGSLPGIHNLQDIWDYYKAHYNTPAGKADIQTFYACYKKYVGGPAT